MRSPSPSIGSGFMARYPKLLFLAIFVGVFSFASASARGRPPLESGMPVQIVEASPSLAPFQHVRFCIRYPADCKSDPSEAQRIDLSAETAELLKSVNRSVNTSIAPTLKSYGRDLQDGWTIAPSTGDCNDYAVTKRHMLRESGLPSRALRLSVVKTPSGIGHLILVVATTRGDIVMDNLTELIRPWQMTGYLWLKIQSASDAKYWFEIKAPTTGPSMADANQAVHLARR
jgi:predicted transglutaminase-like cysteine proteinase